MKKAEEESKARTLKYLSISKKISDIRINILFGLQVRGGKIRDLEEELRLVKAELQQEKEEKVDLVTEKV